MINLDMVGRLRENLIVFGADTGDKFKEYLADSPINAANRLSSVCSHRNRRCSPMRFKASRSDD